MARGWTVFVERRGKRWRCRWTGVHGDGQQTFLYKEDADALAVKKRREFDRLDAGLPALTEAPKVTTLGQLALAYLEQARVHKKKRTVDNFDEPAVNSLCDLLGRDRRLVSIVPPDVEGWVVKMGQGGLGKTTVAMRYRQAAAMFNYAVRMKYVTESPMATLRRPKSTAEGRDLSDAELKTLLTHAHPVLWRWAVFALNTMLRIGEIRAFDWRYVLQELDGGDLLVEIPGHVRKTGKPCWVILNAAARAAAGARHASGQPFTTDIREVQRYLEDARRAAELPADIKFHSLRHTAASHYLRNGGHLEDLLKMGLWKDTRSVMRYVHVRPETVAPRFRALSYSLPAPKSEKPASHS